MSTYVDRPESFLGETLDTKRPVQGRERKFASNLQITKSATLSQTPLSIDFHSHSPDTRHRNHPATGAKLAVPLAVTCGISHTVLSSSSSSSIEILIGHYDHYDHTQPGAAGSRRELPALGVGVRVGRHGERCAGGLFVFCACVACGWPAVVACGCVQVLLLVVVCCCLDLSLAIGRVYQRRVSGGSCLLIRSLHQICKLKSCP